MCEIRLTRTTRSSRLCSFLAQPRVNVIFLLENKVNLKDSLSNRLLAVYLSGLVNMEPMRS